MIALSNITKDRILTALYDMTYDSVLELFSGERPTNPDEYPQDQALAVLRLPYPAFAYPANGAMDFNTEEQVFAVADTAGVITWARLAVYGDTVFTGTAGTDPANDFLLNVAEVEQGQVVELLGGSLSFPS